MIDTCLSTTLNGCWRNSLCDFLIFHRTFTL